jgi:hypothetical protein
MADDNAKPTQSKTTKKTATKKASAKQPPKGYREKKVGLCTVQTRYE